MSNYFADGFHKLTSDGFRPFDFDIYRNLRDPLWSRAVFVHKGRNVLIVNFVRDAAQEDFPWPKDDANKAVKKTVQVVLSTVVKPEQESAKRS